jgi:hypothetical protein
MPKIVNYKVYNDKGYVVFEGNGTETATFLKISKKTLIGKVLPSKIKYTVFRNDEKLPKRTKVPFNEYVKDKIDFNLKDKYVNIKDVKQYENGTVTYQVEVIDKKVRKTYNLNAKDYLKLNSLYQRIFRLL